ncbi:unnamed protein product [Mycena citricolor]|uniref:Uncharacterized protein n=1 Tax=Mycena citricolor TaxID=2018698 RepID=A0AAD2HRR9_9AGAR|nr:unnamed protein product [Mycena citricolor]
MCGMTPSELGLMAWEQKSGLGTGASQSVNPDLATGSGSWVRETNSHSSWLDWGYCESMSTLPRLISNGLRLKIPS